MSQNLVAHYVIQFATNIQLLLQQQGSKLRNLVESGSHTGKAASPVDQIGAVNATKVTGRFEPMHRVDAPVDRRWVYPADYDLPQLVDHFDKLRLLNDPSSALIKNAANAMGRAMDDEIIAAFFGTNNTGEQGATPVVFGTALTTAGGQNVGVGVGGTASNLNVAKLREAKRRLMANEVDFDVETLVSPITASQHDSMLNEVQIVSRDYNEKAVLVDGKVQSFLGINFVPIERLQLGTDDAAGSSRMVPIYAKSGMYLGIWEDFQTSVTKRNDLRGEPWQAYCLETIGATRLEEKKIVRVWCRE